ncbi:MAG: hypothetical protein ABIO72_03585 [Patescibacteria group bacterium]
MIFSSYEDDTTCEIASFQIALNGTVSYKRERRHLVVKPSPSAPIQQERRPTSLATIKSPKDVFRFLRGLLAVHIAELHETWKLQAAELKALKNEHHEIMNRASPLQGETPATWIAEIDEWCTKYIYASRRVGAVASNLRKARKEYMFLRLTRPQ